LGNWGMHEVGVERIFSKEEVDNYMVKRQNNFLEEQKE